MEKKLGPTTGPKMNGNEIIRRLEGGIKTDDPNIDGMVADGADFEAIMDSPLANPHSGKSTGETLRQTLARLMNEKGGKVQSE